MDNYETLIAGTLESIGLSGVLTQREGRRLTLNGSFKALVPTKENLALGTQAILEAFLSSLVSNHLPTHLETFAQRKHSPGFEGDNQEFKTEEILNLYFRYFDKYKQPLGTEPPSIEEQARVSRQFYSELKEIGGFRVYASGSTNFGMIYHLVYSLKPRTVHFFDIGLMKFHFHFSRLNQRRHFKLTMGYQTFNELEDYSALDEVIEERIQHDIEADTQLKRSMKASLRVQAEIKNSPFHCNGTIHKPLHERPFYWGFRRFRP